MKKLILAFVIMIASLGITKAQDSKFELGLKTGFNSTKIKLDYKSSDLDNDWSEEAKSGFLFGAYARLKLIGNLSFQPELYYAKKGLDVGSSDYNGNLKTWDIPLLANLNLLDLKVARIYGVAGPVASFMSTDDIKNNDMTNTNWTFMAGGGVAFWRLTADVRYEWGLKDVSDLKEFNVGQKTDVLTFSLGFRLFGI